MKQRKHGYDINKSGVRAGLAPRREPYWRELADGCFLGFRKQTADSVGNWVGRWTSNEVDGEGRRIRKGESFGSARSMTYDEADKAARTWFAQCAAGVVHAGTVEEGCRAYVAHQRSVKGDPAGDTPEATFKALVYGTRFGRIRMDKLTSSHIRDWLNGLLDDTRTRATANRKFRTLKAALNFAFQNEMCPSDSAWRRVKQLTGDGSQDEQRTVYLTPAQRGRLLAHCSDDLRDLLVCLLLTGARPFEDTELPAATVRDFDAKQRTLELRHKKGKGKPTPRTIPLSAAAVELLSRLTKGKLPGALLFTCDDEPWTRHKWARGIRDAVTAANDELLAEQPKKKLRLVSPDLIPADTCAYTMRHCAICDRLAAGIGVTEVAKMSGTSVAMIEKYYFKFIPGTVTDKLEAITAF